MKHVIDLFSIFKIFNVAHCLYIAKKYFKNELDDKNKKYVS